jgi:hypothetical protein
MKSSPVLFCFVIYRSFSNRISKARHKPSVAREEETDIPLTDVQLQRSAFCEGLKAGYK